MNGEYDSSLHQLLLDADLLSYYDLFKTQLKVTSLDHLKYVTDSDLFDIGMTKPERRRFLDFKEKTYPASVFGKLKKKVRSSVAGKDSSGKSGASFASEASVLTEQHIIPSGKIILCQRLGGGEFGEVWQGVWKLSASEKVQVAVKCIAAERMSANTLNLVQEAAIMHKIHHENIVRFYGVVLEPKNIMLVTQLAPLRSLLECLKHPQAKTNFNLLRLCDFAEQICAGMSYLEKNRLIHRDLAARNILVFGVDKVKISDFGLSRALGAGEEYYRGNMGVSVRLPIAWCAPECIKFLKFTSASDVWAFGVTLWETFTYGFQPWLGMNGSQILQAIDSTNGQRLEMPDDCPLDYFSAMQQMWAYEPNCRPKFADLVDLLPDMRPETVRAVHSCLDGQPDHLQYDTGDLILVLNKRPREYPDGYFWKGVIIQKQNRQAANAERIGRTGLFYPSNTVAQLTFDPTDMGPKSIRDHLKITDFSTSLPSTPLSGKKAKFGKNPIVEPTDLSNGTLKHGARNFDETVQSRSFGNLRNSLNRNKGKQKLHRHDISGPQNDFKHMVHVGVDGECFGEVGFMPIKSHVPLQVVAPFNVEERDEASPDGKRPAPDPAPDSTPGNGATPSRRLLPRFPANWTDFISQRSPPPVAGRRPPSTTTTSETAHLVKHAVVDGETPATSSLDSSATGLPKHLATRIERTDSNSLLDEVFEALQSHDFFAKQNSTNRSLTDSNSAGHINLGARLSSSSNPEEETATLLPKNASRTSKDKKESHDDASYFSPNIKLLSASETKMLDDLTDIAVKISDKTLSRERSKLERLMDGQASDDVTSCVDKSALLDPLRRLASSTFKSNDGNRSADVNKSFCDNLPPPSDALNDRIGVDAQNAYKTLVERRGGDGDVVKKPPPTSPKPDVKIASGKNDGRIAVIENVGETSSGDAEDCRYDDDDDDVNGNPLRLLRSGGGVSVARRFQRTPQRSRFFLPSSSRPDSGVATQSMTSSGLFKVPPPVPPKPRASDTVIPAHATNLNYVTLSEQINNDVVENGGPLKGDPESNKSASEKYAKTSSPSAEPIDKAQLGACPTFTMESVDKYELLNFVLSPMDSNISK